MITVPIGMPAWNLGYGRSVNRGIFGQAYRDAQNADPDVTAAGGGVWSSDRGEPTSGEPEVTINETGESRSEPELRANDQTVCNRGDANAPIRLEVFSDYECPSCRAFYLQTMKQVFTNYADSGKVCVVYREYPTYPRSREAARFARAALRVGPAEWGRVRSVVSITARMVTNGGHRVCRRLSSRGRGAGGRPETSAGSVTRYHHRRGRDHGSATRSPGYPTSFITAGGRTEKVDGALTYAGMQRRLDGLP